MTNDQQDKEGVDAFEKWLPSALVPKGFTAHDRLKHTWNTAFAAGRAACEKEILELIETARRQSIAEEAGEDYTSGQLDGYAWLAARIRKGEQK